MWVLILILVFSSGCSNPGFAYSKDLNLRIVEIAKGEIGKGEQVGNNLGINVARYGGIQGAPWCAAFATWVWRKAGAQPMKARLRVSDIAAESTRNGFYRMLPTPGDIVMWERNGPGSGQDHCGIVIAVHSNGSFETIEGNVGSFPAKVRIFKHHMVEPNLIGFAEPVKE